MPQFNVDEDLAALVEKLAKPKPFENLSFNSALGRILKDYIAALEKIEILENNKEKKEVDELDYLLAESMALRNAGLKKAPSPNAAEWAAKVPELKFKAGLSTWKSICNELGLDTAGDSARRKLKNWAKFNRPNWPAIPDTD